MRGERPRRCQRVAGVDARPPPWPTVLRAVASEESEPTRGAGRAAQRRAGRSDAPARARTSPSADPRPTCADPRSAPAPRRREITFKRREEILKNKDRELQESLIKFNKFLQDNDSKRSRAEKKVRTRPRSRTLLRPPRSPRSPCRTRRALPAAGARGG